MKPTLPSVIIATLAIGCSGQSPHPTKATTPSSSESAAIQQPTAQHSTCVPDSRGSSTPKTGWKKAGQITLTLQGGIPVSLQAQNGSGAVTPSKSLKNMKREEFEQALLQGLCDAGGVMSDKEKDPSDPKNGVISIDVLAPEKEDEHADFIQICAKRDFGEGVQTPSADFAGLLLELQWLTSPRLRSWNIETRKLFATALEKQPPELDKLHARANELETMAQQAGFSSCSYVEAIRRLK